eukprot:scaffold5943_cov113-Isochrysis_galbana.AAC.1
MLEASQAAADHSPAAPWLSKPPCRVEARRSSGGREEEAQSQYRSTRRTDMMPRHKRSAAVATRRTPDRDTWAGSQQARAGSGPGKNPPCAARAHLHEMKRFVRGAPDRLKAKAACGRAGRWRAPIEQHRSHPRRVAAVGEASPGSVGPYGADAAAGGTSRAAAAGCAADRRGWTPTPPTRPTAPTTAPAAPCWLAPARRQSRHGIGGSTAVWAGAAPRETAAGATRSAGGRKDRVPPCARPPQPCIEACTPAAPQRPPGTRPSARADGRAIREALNALALALSASMPAAWLHSPGAGIADKVAKTAPTSPIGYNPLDYNPLGYNPLGYNPL